MSSTMALTDRDNYYLRGPFILWCLIFVVGGFAEEYWRAVCITGLQRNDFGPLSANLMTSMAFVLAHLSGLPSRIGAGGPNLGFEFIVGFAFGSLFIWSGNVTTSLIANVVYYVALCYLLRQRYGRKAGN